MPSPHALLSAFGFTKGMRVKSYKIVSASSTHEVLENYKLYQYHVRLHFASTLEGKCAPSDVATLVNYLKKMVGVSRIVYSQFNNPYECKFVDDPKISNTKDCGNVYVEWNARGERISARKKV
jgi:hypothetical protein